MNFEVGQIYLDGSGVRHLLLRVDIDAEGPYSQLVALRWDERFQRFWWPVQFNSDGTYGTSYDQDAYGDSRNLKCLALS